MSVDAIVPLSDNVVATADSKAIRFSLISSSLNAVAVVLLCLTIIRL